MTCEDEYQKIISAYPDIKIVEGYISHIKISLINNVELDIDYKKYPKKPKIILIKPDGQKFKNLDKMVSTLNRWDTKNASSIIDIINDIILFISGVESHMVLIKSELINGILGICYEHHPRETLGFLKLIDGIFSEFILPPGATTSETSAVYSSGRLPIDTMVQGTIHSHPNGNIHPSSVDLEKVFRGYEFNFIAGYPYNNHNCVKCFDQLGNEVKIKVI